MAMWPRICLKDRNEIISFERPGLRCQFNCYLSPDSRTWRVIDEPSCQPDGTELTAQEREEVLSAVSRYLGRVWWFGIFPRSYKVQFQSGRGYV
jgi:hypothetical protein